jgi:hypothetical protein
MEIFLLNLMIAYSFYLLGKIVAYKDAARVIEKTLKGVKNNK